MKIANCKSCGITFEYKWTGRGNCCSSKCTADLIRKQKQKYSAIDIQNVINLKKTGKSNADIVILSGVKSDKVKRIIKEFNLFLTPDVRQKYAYTAKLKKNPNAMSEMRSVHMEFSQEELDCKLQALKEDVEQEIGSVTGLSRKYGLNPNSVTIMFNKRGWGNLLNIGLNSTPELELGIWLKEHRIPYKVNDRRIIGPKEIDIYIPHLKLGIEYCGLYWHSNDKKPTTYHRDKMKLVESKGIRLITIFEDEWLERKSQVLGFLSSVLSINKIKIMARKCKISPISKIDSMTFLDANHIQGASSRSIVFYGLMYEGSLVGVMTGSKHHRQGYESDLILDRLCFTDGVSIAGGSSRLLVYLIEYAKFNGFKRIVSWSDNRWSQGNVYKSLNFQLEAILKPDYSYIKSQKRLSKQGFKKSEIAKKYPEVYSPEKTESQMTKELGLQKIYDCGKKRWVLSLK